MTLCLKKKTPMSSSLSAVTGKRSRPQSLTTADEERPRRRRRRTTPAASTTTPATPRTDTTPRRQLTTLPIRALVYYYADMVPHLISLLNSPNATTLLVLLLDQFVDAVIYHDDGLMFVRSDTKAAYDRIREALKNRLYVPSTATSSSSFIQEIQSSVQLVTNVIHSNMEQRTLLQRLLLSFVSKGAINTLSMLRQRQQQYRQPITVAFPANILIMAQRYEHLFSQWTKLIQQVRTRYRQMVSVIEFWIEQLHMYIQQVFYQIVTPPPSSSSLSIQSTGPFVQQQSQTENPVTLVPLPNSIILFKTNADYSLLANVAQHMANETQHLPLEVIDALLYGVDTGMQSEFEHGILTLHVSSELRMAHGLLLDRHKRELGRQSKEITRMEELDAFLRELSMRLQYPTNSISIFVLVHLVLRMVLLFNSDLEPTSRAHEELTWLIAEQLANARDRAKTYHSLVITGASMGQDQPPTLSTFAPSVMENRTILEQDIVPTSFHEEKNTASIGRLRPMAPRTSPILMSIVPSSLDGAVQQMVAPSLWIPAGTAAPSVEDFSTIEPALAISAPPLSVEPMTTPAETTSALSFTIPTSPIPPPLTPFQPASFYSPLPSSPSFTMTELEHQFLQPEGQLPIPTVTTSPASTMLTTIVAPITRESTPPTPVTTTNLETDGVPLSPAFFTDLFPSIVEEPFSID